MLLLKATYKQANSILLIVPSRSQLGISAANLGLQAIAAYSSSYSRSNTTQNYTLLLKYKPNKIMKRP